MANLKTTGMALATAAALLFGSVAVTTVHAEDAKVKCQGGNACKANQRARRQRAPVRGRTVARARGM
jgi:hypothetical protein